MAVPVHLKLLVLIYITMEQTYIARGERYCRLRDKHIMVEAVAACSVRGMRLVQPKTLEHLNRLNEYLTKQYKNDNTWVHLYYTGYWVWGDGTNLTNKLLWGDQELKRVEHGEHCAKIRYSRLYPANCSIPKMPVCEYEPGLHTREFLVSVERKNAVPRASVSPFSTHRTDSVLFCFTKCLQNPKCASFAIRNRDTCLLYDTVKSVESAFVVLTGSAYYVMPCGG